MCVCVAKLYVLMYISGTKEKYGELEQLLEDIATFYEDVAAVKEVLLANKKLDAKKKAEDRTASMEKGTSMFPISIYIIQFVFVHDSRLNYAKNSHQSLRNYRDPLGRTTLHISITHPVVSMAFPIYFRYSLRG